MHKLFVLLFLLVLLFSSDALIDHTIRKRKLTFVPGIISVLQRVRFLVTGLNVFDNNIYVIDTNEVLIGEIWYLCLDIA